MDLLLFLLIGPTFASILQSQNSDEIDPIKQTEDDAEENDQSKRTIFSNGNFYALEKHVKYYPSGQKYVLGYRPVKLHLVPVAKPLYTKSVVRPMMRLRPVHIGNKPVVSLVPPKINPVYKPDGYVYNKPLPVNVPPSIPSKPWQHQGWNVFKSEVDKKPFVPSTPLPEPDNNVPEPNFIQPSAPPTVFPATPSVHIQPRPSFNVAPVQPSIAIQPIVPVNPNLPIQPTVSFQSVVPVPPPLPLQPTLHLPPSLSVSPSVHPAIPIHPEGPFRPSINTIMHHQSLVPISLLPGKLNIPVPDLGVLPLGSSVPIQLTSHHPQIHKPSIAPIGASVPIHVLPQLPPIIQKTPVLPFGTSLPVNLPHLHSTVVQKTPVIEPTIEQKFVPQLHAAYPTPQDYVGKSQSGFMPEENSEHMNFQVSVSQQESDPGSTQYLPPQRHNFQYFVQHFPRNNVQQQLINVEPQQHYQNYEQEHQQQIQQHGHHESFDYFQPGKTDLQIPEYLPDHPHFKQLQHQQDGVYDVKKR